MLNKSPILISVFLAILTVSAISYACPSNGLKKDVVRTSSDCACPLRNGYENEDCAKRKLALVFLEAGDEQAYKKVVCSIKGSEVTDTCKELSE